MERARCPQHVMLIFGVLLALPLWSLILACVAMVTQMLGFVAASSILAQVALVSAIAFVALGTASAAAAQLARRRAPA